jgi:GNAT superfamily N-acetyltransferase
MGKSITIGDVSIRTNLRPGDLGQILLLHGTLYSREYQYNIAFESYVAGGLHEFYSNFNPEKDRVWICEHGDQMVGFMLLMHRSSQLAQLRFFILVPDYRGLGLGKLLMDHFMLFLKDANYQGAYLWTTNEQKQAASLYASFGFRLTEEKESTAFGKPLKEQRYEFQFI